MKLSARETLNLIRAGREGNQSAPLDQINRIRQLVRKFAENDPGPSVEPDHVAVAICQDIYDESLIDSDTDEFATEALLRIDGMLALGSM